MLSSLRGLASGLAWRLAPAAQDGMKNTAAVQAPSPLGENAGEGRRSLAAPRIHALTPAFPQGETGRAASATGQPFCSAAHCTRWRAGRAGSPVSAASTRDPAQGRDGSLSSSIGEGVPRAGARSAQDRDERAVDGDGQRHHADQAFGPMKASTSRCSRRAASATLARRTV